jgi:hypothetical protein
MAKQNYCSISIEFHCTVVQTWEKCRFFRSDGKDGCLYFSPVGTEGYCSSEAAKKNAFEKQRQKEYAKTWLTR